MEKAARETVIVVHGTWSPQKKGDPPNWYAPGQGFCKRLDAELEKRGSNARCWAHVATGEDFFHWDGKNDWLSRARTTARLRKEIRRLRRDEGFVVHLVGHSHGGNVIVDAVTDDEGRTQPWFDGRAVLFGTPVYRNSWSLRKRRLRRRVAWLVLSLLFWLGVVHYSTRDFNLLAAFGRGTSTEYFALFVALALLFSVAFLLLMAFGVLQLRAGSMKYRSSPAFLTINTQYDEAYRSLSGLRGATNPFLVSEAPAVGTEEATSRARVLGRVARGIASPLVRLPTAIGRVLDSLRSGLSAQIKKTLDIRTLMPISVVSLLLVATGLFWRSIVSATRSQPLGAPGLSLAFLSAVTLVFISACFFRRILAGAVLLPGIVAANAVSVTFRALTGVVLVSFDRAVKKAAWGLVRSLSLGISGAPRSVEDIEVSLEVGGDHLHLDLPEAIVSDVKKQQLPQLAKIQELLYQKDVKWSLEQLREQLEGEDFPMIHTTYYQNEDCIEKAADWIAEPMCEFFDGHAMHDTTQGPIEGPNGYRNHLGRLELRISSPGSIWRKPLTEFEESLVASSCGIPPEYWANLKDKILTPGDECSGPPPRVPPPPKVY